VRWATEGWPNTIRGRVSDPACRFERLTFQSPRLCRGMFYIHFKWSLPKTTYANASNLSARFDQPGAVSFSTFIMSKNINKGPTSLTNRSTRTLPPLAVSSASLFDFSSPSSAPQSAPPVNSDR
jgi:hypothetical protein